MKNNSFSRNIKGVLLAGMILLFGGFVKANRNVPADMFLAPLGVRMDTAVGLEKFTRSQTPLALEREKIAYLIGKIGNSSYGFIRNGATYTGKEAASHLRMKYRYAFDRIQSARQFIDLIASRSSQTGEEYFLRTADKRYYPVREILYNELARLEGVILSGSAVRT